MNQDNFLKLMKLRARAEKLYTTIYELGDANQFQQDFETTIERIDMEQFQNATDRSPDGLANACAFDYATFEEALVQEIGRAHGDASSQWTRAQLRHAIKDDDEARDTAASPPDFMEQSEPSKPTQSHPSRSGSDADLVVDTHTGVHTETTQDTTHHEDASAEEKAIASSAYDRLARQRARIRQQMCNFIPEGQPHHPLSDWAALLDGPDETLPDSVRYLSQASTEELRWVTQVINHLSERAKQ
jgi:hypothetical protein